ncbi:BnaC06g40980D [Brassica napus]|uniref:BnaC06g40980D protein n=1 Tax=Brassica napus TaxID=3708 RepID=A0A078JAG9_BRANA|nr:BnaC06g40980D [Brassica napus]
MANAAIFLFDLKTGRCSSTIQVRLLCFLEPMNVRWGSELMGVDMFLLDSQLLGLANTNTQFPDIISEVTAAKSTVTDPPHDKNRLMATIKMDNDVSVTMSMFDSQPVKLHNQLESMGGDPRVWLQPVSTPKLWEAHAYILTRKPSQGRLLQAGCPRHWACASSSIA